MAETAKYYLGRVIKLGRLSNSEIRTAVTDSTQVRRGQYHYTFTDALVDDQLPDGGFLFARLTKFRLTGEVPIVLPDQHVASVTDIPNLVYASSPFVYLPGFSGIAYQHIWNKLEREQFERVFAELLEERFDGMFAKASVEPVSDLRTFVERVAGLTRITAISATVHPPNPLFGPAWESLRDYLRRRNLGELEVKEDAADADGISTNIAPLARTVLDGSATSPADMRRMIGEVPSVADAALLMAADGYGRARVEGRRGQQYASIRTQDAQYSFRQAREPDPHLLYSEAHAILQRISDERYLEHP